MLEGLWITRFVASPSESLETLSGVIVIETGRILGGDSGFLFIGDVGEKSGDSWPVTISIKRHDESVEGIFGDLDEYVLKGRIVPASAGNGEHFTVHLGRAETDELVVSLTKAANLP